MFGSDKAKRQIDEKGGASREQDQRGGRKPRIGKTEIQGTGSQDGKL